MTRSLDIAAARPLKVSGSVGDLVAAGMVVAEGFTARPVALGLGAPLELRGGDPEALRRLTLGLGFAWQKDLLCEVGHAARNATDPGSPWFKLPPLLLLGDAGAGRTHVARRLAHLAGVPHVWLDLSDPAAGGQLRQLPCGPDLVLPAVPVLAMAASGCANPVVSVIGIDGADAATQHALAEMIEPETAGRWCDYAVGATMDLRQVNWVVQSHDSAALSHRLTSLLRPIELSWPNTGDLPLHAAEVLAEAAIDADALDSVPDFIGEGLDCLVRLDGHRSTARLYQRAREWLASTMA